MDNDRNLPGYKYYVDRQGHRPSVYVAFLDVLKDPRSRVNGVCTPVDEQRLVMLDAREQNYVRRDVSGQLDARGARVWTYEGSNTGRRRLLRGRRLGRLVIDSNYLAAVHDAFRQLGEREHTICSASLEPGDLPTMDLVRVDLP